MKYFIEEGNGKKVIIRLDSGDMLLESIEPGNSGSGHQKWSGGFRNRNPFGYKNHMVTTTSYPAVEIYPEWKDVPMELSSISGIIADYMPHLHMVFSSPEKTYSGHLEHGCKTLYLCEIVIEVFEKLELQRRKNSKGIMELEEK